MMRQRQGMLWDPASSRVRAALVVAAAFLGVMALFFIYYDPYRDGGGDILVGGDFEQPPFGEHGAKSDGPWRGSGVRIRWEPQGGFDSSGGMLLKAYQGQSSSLRYVIDDPRRFQFLRVAGRLRSNRVVDGEHRWHIARLLLFFTDRNGQPHWEHPHNVCSIAGTQPWRRCMQVIAVPDFAVTAHLSVDNAASSGTIWFDELRLTPAVEKSSALAWRAIFATLWCGVAAYCAWTAKLPRQRFGLPIIATGILIIVGVSTPEPVLEQMVNRGAQDVNGLVTDHLAGPGTATVRANVGSPGSTVKEVRGAVRNPSLSFGAVTTVKKTGHFVLFALLALVALLSATRSRSGESPVRRPAALATVTVALLLFAAATEILQFVTATRTSTLSDWAINAGGILAGATIALVGHRAFPDTVAPRRTA
jgi:hypothetical protein